MSDTKELLSREEIQIIRIDEADLEEGSSSACGMFVTAAVGQLWDKLLKQ